MAAAKRAQPPAKPGPTSTETAAAIRKASDVHTTKNQEACASEASEFAAALGWDGDGDWVWNKIQCKDARVFLTKTFHEVHVAALNPSRKPPTADAVCKHLGIEDAQEVALVKGKLEQLFEREKGKPASPN